MSNYWNPNNYTLEHQLLDTIGGRDVVTSDDGTVIKGNDSHVDIYWPSSSSKGHGHAGFDYVDENRIDPELYHN